MYKLHICAKFHFQKRQLYFLQKYPNVLPTQKRHSYIILKNQKNKNKFKFSFNKNKNIYFYYFPFKLLLSLLPIYSFIYFLSIPPLYLSGSCQ
ncbi:unnamed protein product [Meloidogyne enterolobii]|uniref:Uncharacterized protein n=1 Tax=Meloidogyne enterolobii TaxID=390850 RepID=A0ACB0XQ60_MELEN